MSATDKNRDELKRMMKEKENKYCADCGAFPANWASTNLGVFLCVACGGIHRSLGVHISFVKSATLDVWNAKLLHHFKQQGGNAAVNRKYEAKLKSVDKINPKLHQDPSCKIEIVKFIRNKYEKKLWFKEKTESKKKKKSKKMKHAKVTKSKPKFMIMSKSTTQTSEETMSPSHSFTPSPNLHPVKRKESMLSDDDLDEFHRDFNNRNVQKEPTKVVQVPDILELIQEFPSVKKQNQAMDHKKKGNSKEEWVDFNESKQSQDGKTGSAADAILSKYQSNNVVNMNINMNMNMSTVNCNVNMSASLSNGVQYPPQHAYTPPAHYSPVAHATHVNYTPNVITFNPINNNYNNNRKMTW